METNIICTRTRYTSTVPSLRMKKGMNIQQQTITLNLPQSERLTITIDGSLSQSTSDALKDDLRNVTAISLYKQGMISMLQSADLIGCDRREFEEILIPKYGYSMMNERDLELEMEYIKQHT